ncbi:hypothetical protein BJX63DRAFT_442773 [Aspergillus granulosus]|uniref:Integral membrane protein n=1 Tax=Aspergillus granulosus TaxID=176169 RepID=A0ABR4HDU4_9EURO
MNATFDEPLFVANEVLCAYPISTTYNDSPRYLFYALLAASLLTHWMGWLADAFLGAAATYAGTAAIQSFIFVTHPERPKQEELVSIPYVSPNSTLRDRFPSLVAEASQIPVRAAAQELDMDAVLAIVVTAYLIFLPLQSWSRAISDNRSRWLLFTLWNMLMLAGTICALVTWPKLRGAPAQYAFCSPYYPAQSPVSSDGWQSWQRTSTWNESVWTIFGNDALWQQLPDLCIYPCFNTTQILRQQNALQAYLLSDVDASSDREDLWDKVSYSTQYIYALIALTAVLNSFLFLHQILPYRSRIPSSLAWNTWKERSAIRDGLKKDFYGAFYAWKGTATLKTTQGNRFRNSIRVIFPLYVAGLWLRLVLDVGFLCALVLSIIISPLTVIAFIVWIEYYIHQDGPPSETPSQVGQWSPLVAIGFLIVSAAIFKLKHWLASPHELDHDIEELRQEIEILERWRDEPE